MQAMILTLPGLATDLTFTQKPGLGGDLIVLSMACTRE